MQACPETKQTNSSLQHFLPELNSDEDKKKDLPKMPTWQEAGFTKTTATFKTTEFSFSAAE